MEAGDDAKSTAFKELQEETTVPEKDVDFAGSRVVSESWYESFTCYPVQLGASWKNAWQWDTPESAEIRSAFWVSVHSEQDVQQLNLAKCAKEAVLQFLRAEAPKVLQKRKQSHRKCPQNKRRKMAQPAGRGDAQ